MLREILAHPPKEMSASAIEEASFQLAESLGGCDSKYHAEAIDLYEKALREFLARYRRPTHAGVLRVSSGLAMCMVRLGGQPGRLLNDLEPHYSDLRIDDNTGLNAAHVIASLHLCRAQVGEGPESYQTALSAIRRILKQKPIDENALYMQLLLAKEMSKQGLSEHALPLVLEVQTLVSSPDAPEATHYLRLGSLQTLYGIYMILGNGKEAEAIRAQIPNAVPQLPEHLIHPSLRKVTEDQQQSENSTPADLGK
jgi:tetratricopeptide (TPR) repeat protein